MPELVEVQQKVKIILSGTVESSICEELNGFYLRLSTLDREGKRVNTKSVLYSASTFDNLALSLESKKADYLLLEFIGNGNTNKDGYCSISIDNLAVSTSKI